MNTKGQVWAFSLLGAVALLAPACGSDDGEPNNSNAGAAGAAGHSAAGSANTAGNTNTAGQTSLAGTGNGGDAGSENVAGGGAGGAPACGGLDKASGVVTCGEVKYRESVGTGCFYSPGDMEPEGGAGGGAGDSSLGGAGGTESACDPAKCTEKPRGYCQADSFDPGPAICHYGCLVDSECGAKEICVCGGDPTHGGRCVEASCKTDADCTNGNRCGSNTECDQFSCTDERACAVN